ncbi:MAG: hypothetical protein ACRYF5_06290 [Janthinobacterium lividum]
MRFNMGLLAWLNSVFGAWRNFFSMMFFLLLDFFVVRDVTWVCHGNLC